MKKSLLALAVLGAIAGVAQAQSSVVIYGNVDAGLIKRTDQTMAIGKRANNTLGFKGTEDLGNGLKAIFQLEMRYEPDTGIVESNARPLFQGQSRVGLTGNFGTVRIGRGLTAFQESAAAFEPFHGIPSPVGFATDLAVGGYTSEPLAPLNSSLNRFSNALFYNSPEFMGIQINTTIAARESVSNAAVLAQYPISAAGMSTPSDNPYSISATWKSGPAALMLAAERNAVETTVKSFAGSLMVGQVTKLMFSITRQDQSHTVASNLDDTKAWVLGANFTFGASKFLVGYGEKSPENKTTVKQASLGYEYSLSKRTYLYTDLSNKSGAPLSPSSTKNTMNLIDLGINHSF